MSKVSYSGCTPEFLRQRSLKLQVEREILAILLELVDITLPLGAEVITIGGDAYIWFPTRDDPKGITPIRRT